MLTKKAAMKQPRITQSVIQRWLHDMIDAGWCFRLNHQGGGDDAVFYHADDYLSSVDKSQMHTLCRVFWETGEIPSAYNVEELIDEMQRKDAHEDDLG